MTPEPTRPVKARIGAGSLVLTTLVLAAIIIMAFGLGVLGWAVVAVVALMAAFEFSSWFIDRDPAVAAFGAQPADPVRDRDLIATVHELADLAGIDRPRVYVAQGHGPNAFATSTRHGGIVVMTREAQAVLDDDEVRAVLAHEVGHIKNRDPLWRAVTATLIKGLLAPAVIVVGVITVAMMLSSKRDNQEFGEALHELFTGLRVMIVQSVEALSSRSRELMADQSAVDVGASPRALITALESMESAASSGTTGLTAAEAQVGARMFVNPAAFHWSGRAFASHPTIETRARRLSARMSPSQRAAAQSQIRAARDRRQRERATRQLKRQIADLTAAREFAAGLSPRPAGPRATQTFGLRRGEQIYADFAADLVEIRRPQGVDTWAVTQSGRAVVTTLGIVFAGTKRVRFDWNRITSSQWLGDGDALVMQTTTRQRPSGIACSSDVPLGLLTQVAQSDHAGGRTRLLRQLDAELQQLRSHLMGAQ